MDNKTKLLVENLEKLTGKKVVLKEHIKDLKIFESAFQEAFVGIKKLGRLRSQMSPDVFDLYHNIEIAIENFGKALPLNSEQKYN